MFDINPFAQLSSSVPPLVMQLFVIVMILMVAGGTLFDIIHKGSAKYFFQLVKKSKANGTLTVSTGEKLAVVVKTTAHDVLASGEFCSTRRRIAHLLTMYGFVIYVVSTVIMVFCYSSLDTLTPAILPYLWWLGGAMICVGGYWFWFFIRVDVSAEGNSPFRLIRADLFVVSLMASVTFGLIWAYLQGSSNAWSTLVLALYLIATLVFFGSVPWSKFSHMFFKPAAAYQKNLAIANGGRRNLPPPSDSPAIYGKAQRHTHNY
jgi:hypothetical protein